MAEVSDEEQKENAAKLRVYLDRIAILANSYREQIIDAARQLEIDLEVARSADRDAVQELVEEQLVRGEDFDSLVDDLIEEVEARFELVGDGEFVRGRDQWPIVWEFESDDRAEFIHSVNRFSSNYCAEFRPIVNTLGRGHTRQGTVQTGMAGGTGTRGWCCWTARASDTPLIPQPAFPRASPADSMWLTQLYWLITRRNPCRLDPPPCSAHLPPAATNPS